MEFNRYDMSIFMHRVFNTGLPASRYDRAQEVWNGKGFLSSGKAMNPPIDVYKEIEVLFA